MRASHARKTCLIDFHGKTMKNHGFPRFPSGSWEIWVSIQTTPPRCVQAYRSPLFGPTSCFWNPRGGGRGCAQVALSIEVCGRKRQHEKRARPLRITGRAPGRKYDFSFLVWIPTIWGTKFIVFYLLLPRCGEDMV